MHKIKEDCNHTSTRETLKMEEGRTQERRRTRTCSCDDDVCYLGVLAELLLRSVPVRDGNGGVSCRPNVVS